MSSREPKLLLSDIISSISKIKAYTRNYTLETFIEDSKTIDAVIRNYFIVFCDFYFILADEKAKRGLD